MTTATGKRFEIALWLVKREPYVRALLDAETIEDAMVARTRLHDFEREHPRPGSI